MPIIGDYNWAPALDLSTVNYSIEEDLSSYTVLAKIPSTLLQNVGNYIQLTLHGPLNGCTLSNVTISEIAATGNAYDADTTPTAITWDGGSASVELVFGGSYISDPIAFPFTISPKLIGFNISTTSYVPMSYLENCLVYRLTGVQEADNTTRSGNYEVFSNSIPFISDLQVSE
jgi:hypothetical protein